MKFLKGLAILIFVFGLFCFLLSLYMLLTLESTLQLWERLQQAGMAGANKIGIAGLRKGIIVDAIWIGGVGLLSIISGFGLFIIKDWARRLWLGVLVFLAAVNLYQAVVEYLKEGLGWDRLFGYLIFAAITVGLWIYFSRKKTKDSFLLHRA